MQAFLPSTLRLLLDRLYKRQGELRSKNAVRLIEKSVKGMLPHNTLGRAQGMKLKVFVGAEHTHAAQQPEVLDISGLI